MNRTIYHGYESIIERPRYGLGKVHNDYGLGFYCTFDLELAKEWAVRSIGKDGFVNVYSFDDEGLNVLNLDDNNVLCWISILLNNRTFGIKGELASAAISYLNEYFSFDYSIYDVIQGWRADDSYFAYANDFINGTISLQRLGRAMKLGNLGLQYVLKSRLAFERISFKEAIPVSAEECYPKRMKRDSEAREKYLHGERFSLDKDDLCIIDIIREEIGPDDSRLQ